MWHIEHRPRTVSATVENPAAEANLSCIGVSVASSSRWLPGALDSHMMMTKMIAVAAQVQFGCPLPACIVLK